MRKNIVTSLLGLGAVVLVVGGIFFGVSKAKGISPFTKDDTVEVEEEVVLDRVEANIVNIDGIEIAENYDEILGNQCAMDERRVSVEEAMCHFEEDGIDPSTTFIVVGGIYFDGYGNPIPKDTVLASVEENKRMEEEMAEAERKHQEALERQKELELSSEIVEDNEVEPVSEEIKEETVEEDKSEEVEENSELTEEKEFPSEEEKED